MSLFCYLVLSVNLGEGEKTRCFTLSSCCLVSVSVRWLLIPHGVVDWSAVVFPDLTQLNVCLHMVTCILD